MKKVLFIDRDGTLIVEPPDQQIDSLSKLEFYPGVFTWLGKIKRDTDFELVMVTNQDGLGTARFPEEDFWPAHEKMIQAFSNEGITFSKVHVDRSLPEQQLPTRKPGIGMLTEYFQEKYDLKNSFVIGDRVTDIMLAKNLQAKGILLNDGSLEKEIDNNELRSHCVLITKDWKQIYNALVQKNRVVNHRRVTNETDISVEVNLDGSGISSIKTGLGFFDHMLEQVARHSGADLTIRATGDLHIDEHHTIEDTALALGEAFGKALGDKRGIQRYGYMLPMDDCLAQVAIDFGGRPWIVWDATFSRERVGDVPTEMFYHFFKSFSDAVRCNLNIKAEGTNEHHKIEAIFKAFARSIRMAIKKEGDQLPTTKGILT